MSCKGRHTWDGVSRKPGSSGTLHREGKPRRPCSGWRREKCWADGWPARVPYTAGEKQLCLLTCGTPAASGRAAKGKDESVPQLPARVKMRVNWICTPSSKGGCDRFKWGERVRGGQKRFRGLASPRNGVKRLSSFRPGGQERPGLAEAAGLLGRFMLTRLRGCWREEDRPRAPQTVVGGRRVAWAPPLGGSLLGGGCSLDTEEEGVEKSLALLGMNWLRAADWVLAERNLSTTALTASPNNPDCEMGASIKNVFSLSRISVRLSHRWRSAATEAAHRAPHGTCGVLGGSQSQVSGLFVAPSRLQESSRSLRPFPSGTSAW